MIDLLGNGDEARGYANTAVLVAVIFVVTLMVTVIFSRDRSSLESASSKKSERTSLKYALHVITGNDQLKVYIGVVLAYNLVVQLAGGMALYYFKYVTMDDGLFPYFTTAASLAEMGALFLFPLFSPLHEQEDRLRPGQLHPRHRPAGPAGRGRGGPREHPPSPSSAVCSISSAPA